MMAHDDLTDAETRRLIAVGSIRFDGNARHKIYGSLSCRAGRRLLRRNRVFFASEAEALAAGYRPCGHCMKQAYAKWRG